MSECSKWHVKWYLGRRGSKSFGWSSEAMLLSIWFFFLFLTWTKFGRCEQDTIDSTVYLLANKVDRWYICMETRLLGQYLFPGAATLLSIHE